MGWGWRGFQKNSTTSLNLHDCCAVLYFQKRQSLNNVPFLCTKLFQKRGHYSRGDIIQGRTLIKEIRYLSPIFRGAYNGGAPPLPPPSILQNQGKTWVLPVLPHMAPL